MQIVNITERVALGKLSEHLSSSDISDRDFRWILHMHGINEFQDTHLWTDHILDSQPGKNIVVFNSLHLIFTEYPDRFPKVMETILGKYFMYISKDIVKIQGNQQAKQSLFALTKATFERYLEILGYELQIDFHGETLDLFDVHLLEMEIDGARREARNKLYNILEIEFQGEYIALKGAYERYAQGGTNAYRQAISSCRNAYETFFEQITESSSWNSGLSSNIESTTLIKFIKNVYSFLSGFGDHSPIERTKEDALLAIRITEDVMIRVLMEKGAWL